MRKLEYTQVLQRKKSNKPCIIVTTMVVQITEGDSSTISRGRLCLAALKCFFITCKLLSLYL